MKWATFWLKVCFEIPFFFWLIIFFSSTDIAGDHFDDEELEKELAAMLTTVPSSGSNVHVDEVDLESRLSALTSADKG